MQLKLLDPRLRTWGFPRYGSGGAAGLDLCAALDEPLTLAPGEPALMIPTGIALHIADPRWCALVVPRSGLGHRGLVLGNSVGVIDSDYQGPVLVSAWNRNGPGGPTITVGPGDRIAQLLFVPVGRPVFDVVEEFSTASGRGAGGFGSTGVAAVPTPGTGGEGTP